MRNQTELKFFIGYPEKNETFDKCVIELASKLCGGCFIAQGDGYWMEDGAEHKTLFTGSLASEYCLCIVLSCEDHKVADVLLSMKLGIAAHAGHMQIETDWVHVQKTAFEGLHFSVQETYNAMPRNVVRDFVSPGTRGAMNYDLNNERGNTWSITAKALLIFAAITFLVAMCSGPQPAVAQEVQILPQPQECVSIEQRHALAAQGGWYIKQEFEEEAGVLQMWKQGETGRLLIIVEHADTSCVVGFGEEEPDLNV